MELNKLRKMKVNEDNQLLNSEKETYFYISGDNPGIVHVTTNMKAFIKKMLECNDLKPTRYYKDREGNLVHLEGDLPISHLRFKSRSSDSMNYVSRILAG